MSINSRELLVVPRMMTSDNHRLRRGGLGKTLHFSNTFNSCGKEHNSVKFTDHI